jgi:hydroxypyruvate isomerase
MDDDRLNRLSEQRARNAGAYGVMDLMQDTRRGVFTPANTNSTYGRALQASYVDGLTKQLDNDKLSADARAAIRANLNAIARMLNDESGGGALVNGHRGVLAQEIRVALSGIEAVTTK